MYQKRVKRLLDLLLAVPVGVALLPGMLLLAAWVRLDSRGPALFAQKRVGIHKSHFQIYKFRTMRADAPRDCPTHQLASPESYITRPGAFLRRTSLDELPQIWNIIRGDMSFVGPRPALWNQEDLVRERERYGANDVMPGLTGWAQIHGRDELEIREKARLDGFYARHLSFRLDGYCLMKTVGSVLKGDGIVEGSHEKNQGQDRE